MKLPDEYSTGSTALNSDRESLATGLVELGITLADATLNKKSFKEILQLSEIDEKERNRILLELIMFNLFVTSWWMMGNFKENYKEILDRMYYHFTKSISDNDFEFGQISNERYLAYADALKNQAGAGSAWWFGLTATRYVLGREDVEKQISIENATQSIWMFGQIMLDVADIIKKFVEQGLYMNRK